MPKSGVKKNTPRMRRVLLCRESRFAWIEIYVFYMEYSEIVSSLEWALGGRLLRAHNVYIK